MNILLLFVKFPESGKVKTRLAKNLGAEKAAVFYKEMVEMLIEKIIPAKKEYAIHLYFDPPSGEKDFQIWLPQIRHQFPQCAGDLGVRLKTAFEKSFRLGGEKIVVIGSDCLEIDRNLILEAFEKLKSHDMVMGPALDGGYYLLGLKKFHPQIFEEIAWSTSEVLEQTVLQAKKLSLKIAQLRPLRDIDTLEDYLTSTGLSLTKV